MSRMKQGFDASLRRLALEQQQPSQNLRALRLEALLSQRELARRSSLAANTVRNAELGHIPLRENQELIAAALSVALNRPIGQYDIWPLTDGEPPPSPSVEEAHKLIESAESAVADGDVIGQYKAKRRAKREARKQRAAA